MARTDLIRASAIGLLLFVIVIVLATDNHVVESTRANGSSPGTPPPASHTGAPSESHCSACHTSTPGGDQFAISGGGAGNTYVPNTTYTITVSHTPTNLWGFQITVLDSSNNRIGNVVSTDSSTVTKCATPTSANVYPPTFDPPCFPGERFYTFHSVRTVNNWSFQWTAPSSDVGPITFYAAGVKGNGDPAASNDPAHTATRTLTAAAPAGTLQFSSATPSVAENGGTATITVSRTGGSSGAASVQYSAAGGTATGGASCTTGVDYITTSSTLNWSSGDASNKSFNVTICNDSVFESNETVGLALSNATGASLGSPTAATLTITNDDSQPAISINDVSQSEGNSGTTNFNFTVSLSNQSTQTVTVNYATADGTATAGSDYTAVGSTLLTFNPLETVKNISVAVTGETTFESNENFFVNLNGASNGAISDSQGVGTILNDDPAPPGSLRFSAATYSVAENGGTATITVERTGGSAGAASVQFSSPAGGSATGGASCSGGVDYITPSSSLNWADGDSTNKTFQVTICNESVFESNETVNLALSNATGASLGAQTTATLTITNDDAQPTISINDVSQAEGNSGTTSMIFTVSLSNPSTQTVTVSYATANVTAMAGSDYTAVASTLLTFNSLETSKNVTVMVTADTTSEPDETFQVNLSGASNATISDSQGIGTIVNDDGTPQPGTLQFSAGTYSVSENGDTATITVTRTGGIFGAASVQFSNPAGGTATGGVSCGAGVDYLTPSGTLNWADGDAGSKTFAVTICNDGVFEANETLNLALSGVTGATPGTQTTAVLTINDDDFALGLILEEFGPTTNQAAALDAFLFTRDPFPVVNSQNLFISAADPNTRVMLFVTNLQLLQAEPPSVVTVNLVDSNNQSYNIPAENVRAVPNNNFTQVTFRLPDSLPPGTCTLKVIAHNQQSNVGTIRIRL
jgi:hypothetical protein